jgi:cytochrome c553
VALHRNPARAHGRRHRHRAVLLLVCVLAAGRLLADQHRQEMPAPAVLQALELEGDPESGARAYEACAVCHLDLARGERLYRSDCQECHGVRGEGDAERFVPVLSGQHYSYLLRQVRAIAGGRRGNASRSMERHARPYSDAELQAVVDFASRLDATRREERH